MKHIIIAAALGCTSLTGCAQFAASTVESASTATPQQATTLAEALQAATLVTDATDTYVMTGTHTSAQLVQIRALSNAVHAALVSLEDANAHGKSLVFSSFNAALQAFDAYKGVQ